MSRRPFFRQGLFLALPLAAALAFAAEDDRNAADLPKDLIGTWVSVGTPDDVQPAPAKGGGLKSYTGGHWNSSAVDPKTGMVASNHGGTYMIEGDVYTETVEYASPNMRPFLNKTFKFKLKIENDTLTQTGIDNPFTQVLKRLK